ncbi:FAD dependent oxidoreductase [Clathrospora elynae]|uniref:FAD dependent oxidoreductase n=1 Tax=Clathrospora elynae TaxID=706981 RepID=A0A6A5SRR2_9PLEO|nr:FAD dependent oxidoreductase [Clathrospora elynae]
MEGASRMPDARDFLVTKIIPNAETEYQHQLRNLAYKRLPSYWLRTPHKYAKLRSTAILPRECDVAIIGSGMAGVVTAYHILQTSPPDNLPKLVILDARDLCSGATARNGGHAKVMTATLAGLPCALRSQLQDYVLGVIDAIHRIVDAEDVDCEFELRRSFDVFLDAGEYDGIKRIYEESKTRGERWTKRISLVPEDYVQQVTSIRGAVGAFSVPTASFSPYKFVTGLLEKMMERYPGIVNVQTNTAVWRISTDDQECNVLSTGRGQMKAGKLVLATNAYTAGLLPFFSNTIIPYKGMNSHHVPSSPIHPHLNQTYNIHFAPDASGKTTGVDYLNPRPSGSIVVGGGKWFYEPDKESWYNNHNDSESGRFPPSVEAHWRSYIGSTFLGWEKSKAEADMIWIGIQALTPDKLPHVGRVPVPFTSSKPKQWMLAGFNGGGMGLIATAARAVANMVVRDVGFDQVQEEFGLPHVFKTSTERLA